MISCPFVILQQPTTQATESSWTVKPVNSDTQSILGVYDRGNNEPIAGVLPVFALLSALLCTAIAVVSRHYGSTPEILLSALAVWSVTLALVWRGLRYYPFNVFGWANSITALRAMSTAFVAGLIPIAEQMHDSITTGSMWLVFALAVTTLALDGLDGFLARRTGFACAFGARFDMEIDALLGLVITLFLWQSGKVGVWVLALGLMRYLFVIASFAVVALQSDLFPSFRRKVVCVVQLSALCALLCPWVQAPETIAIGGFAVITLLASFARDVVWLLQHGPVRQT